MFCLTFGITLGDCLVDILRGQRESLSAEVGIAFGAAVTRAVSDVLGTLSFARGIALGD